MKEVGQTTTIIEHTLVKVPGIPNGQGTPGVIKTILFLDDETDEGFYLWLIVWLISRESSHEFNDFSLTSEHKIKTAMFRQSVTLTMMKIRLLFELS